MSTNSQLEDEVLVYQETITKLHSQSTSLSRATSRWKPHTGKWLIRHDSIRDNSITNIMKRIWKRTRDSVFFANLNAPQAVIHEVDTFIGTSHPWKTTGSNKDYKLSPGFQKWEQNKSTASILCAIIHMVPFDTSIPRDMLWAEDVILRDAVAMANGFKPRRKYPSIFMKKRQDVSNEQPQSEAETWPLPQPSEVHMQTIETTTQQNMSHDSDMTLNVASHHENEGVAFNGGDGQGIERLREPREPQAGSSSLEFLRNITNSIASNRRTPETASDIQNTSQPSIQTSIETERRQYKETVRSILTPEEPPHDEDTEMPLAEPDTNDPNRLVSYLREQMKTQVAAAVSQAKKEANEQHDRIAQALEKLMAERDKTLEREVAECKKTILELQAAANGCTQVRRVHQTDASTQTLPEKKGITEEEIKAIIDLAVASYEK